MPVNSNDFSAFDEALKKSEPSVPKEQKDEFAAFDEALAVEKKNGSLKSEKPLVGVSDGTISTTEPKLKRGEFVTGDILIDKNGEGYQIQNGEKVYAPLSDISTIGLPKNAIDLSFDAFNLENQKITRRAPATIGFGTGGGEVVTIEEDPQAKAAAKKIKDDLKAQGYDADKLYDDFKDIDFSGLNKEDADFEKQNLLNYYKENPQLYEKKVATSKFTNFLNKAISELPEEERKSGDFAFNLSPMGDYNSTRAKYNEIKNRIKEYGGEYEKELLKNFSIAVGDYYGQFTNDPSVINDERNKYLNQYQISALQYLEDTNPDAAKGYGSMLVDPSLIKKGSAEEAGWQEKASSLEQIGLRLSKSNIESEILRLANQAKTSPLSIQDVALAKELETKLTDVDNKIKEINIKYPIPAEKEAQTAAMELTDNTTSTWYNRFALSVGNAVDNTFKGVYEFAVEPFMNDEQSKLYQLAAAGESMGMDVIMTLPKEKRISQAYDWQMSPEVSSEYKAIMGNNSLSKDEKTQKVYKLLQENPNGFARIPIIGGKTNISPTSLYYSVTDLAATLTPYLALEAATAGGATAGIARKLASSFMAAAATGFHDNYVAAVREGAANPYKQALITTGIMSFAMAGAGTPQMIRAMAGNKTAIGELVNKLTDKEISVVLDKIKNGTLKNRILDYGKTLGKDAIKSIAEGAKGGVKFESIMAGAKAIDAKIKGKEVHPEELAKEGAIGVLNFTVFGGVMGIGKSAWKGVTDFQGSTLLKASQNPTEYLKAAAKSLADGTITNKDYNQIKNNIELASKVSEGIKFIDDKGVELPESKKAKLLLAKMQEAKLNEDAQGDIPSKLKDDLNNQIGEVKTEIGKIQESEEEVELPEAKPIYKIGDREVSKQEMIDFVESGKAKETAEPLFVEGDTEVESMVKGLGGEVVEKVAELPKAEEKVTEITPIENPKVVITGTRRGMENLGSANYDPKVDAKIQDARGRQFDENGILVETDNQGNQIVHIKVEATDAVNREGYLQISVIVPEGTKINNESIKKVVDAEVEKIKAKDNEYLHLNEVQESDFTALRDAVVNELKNPSVEKAKAGEEVPQAELPVAEEKPTLIGIEQEETIKQMKPFTDRMVEIERDFKNEGFELDTDYDNEIVVTDKNGEIVDAEELPDNLRKLAGDYEKATMKLGEFDASAREKALIESRKLTEVEAEVVEPKKAELPFERENWAQDDYKKELKRLEKEDAKGNADKIKQLQTELGAKLIADLKKSKEQKQVKKEKVIKEESRTQEALNKYEEGEGTFNDLVDKVEAIALDENNQSLKDAVDAYREEQRLDIELKGRGDMDAAESAFMRQIKSELPPTPEKVTPKNLLDTPAKPFTKAVDLLGKPREKWMYEATEAEAEQAKKKNTMRGSQFYPKKITEIEFAIEQGKYEKAIKEGRMTAQDAKQIIESAGLEVPKSIEDLLTKKAGEEVAPKAVAEVPRKPKKEPKVFSSASINRVEAKKAYSHIDSMDIPPDANAAAMHWLSLGGKISVESFVDEVVGRKKSRGAAKIIIPTEAKKSEFTDPKSKKSVEKAAHEIWESLPDHIQEQVTDMEIRDALIDNLNLYSKRIDIAKDFISEYDPEEAARKFYEAEMEENKAAYEKERQELEDWYNGISEEETKVLENEEFLNQLIKEYENEYPELFKTDITEVAEGEKGRGTEKIVSGEAVGKEKEPTAEKVEPKPELPKEEKIAEKTPLQKASEARRAAKAKLDSLRKGLSINEQAKLEALVDYHRTLVAEAKEFIKEKADDINEWAKSIGEKVNIVLQKAWDEAKGAKPVEKAEDLGYGIEDISEPVVGITKKDIKERAAIYNIEIEERREKMTDAEVEAMAKDLIQNGYDVDGLVKEALAPEKRPLTDIEANILAEVAAAMENKIDENSSDADIRKYRDVLSALNKGISENARGLRMAKVKKNKIESMADVMADMMEDNLVDELTPEQRKEAKKRYEDVKKALDNEVKLRKQAEDEIDRLKAELEIERQKKKSEGKPRKSNQEYTDERKQIIQSIKDKWKNAGKGKTYVTLPYAPQLMAIAPDVARLVKSYIDQGSAKTLDQVRSLLKKDIEEAGITVTDEDVRNLIAGNYTEKKPTRNQLSKQLFELRQEEKLLLQLEALERGEKPTTEKKKIERNQKLADLRNKIKELTGKDMNEEFIRTVKAQITTNKNKQQKTQDKIKKGDFSPEEKKQSILENEQLKALNRQLYDDYLKSVLDKDEALLDYEKKRVEDKMKNRTKLEKLGGGIDVLLTTSKGTVAMFDQSVFLVQMLPFALSHPLKTVQFAVRSIRDFSSKTKFDENMALLHGTELYKLIEKTGLAIYEPRSAKSELRNELHGGDKNLWNKEITVKGKKFSVGQAFERATTSALNNARLYLFMSRVQDLYDAGKTFENSPKEFEAAARFINEFTGHGKVQVDVAKASDLVNKFIWSPKMFSSTLNILGLGDITRPIATANAIARRLGITTKESKKYKGFYTSLTPEQGKFATKELTRFIGGGIMIMVATKLASMMNGDDEDDVKIDLDPRSTNFGSMKIKNKSIMVFGRFGSAARTIVQAFGGVRIVKGEEDVIGDKYGEKTSGDIIFGSFARGKATPFAGTAYDFFLNNRKNYYTKEEMTPQTIAKQLLVPMAAQEVLKDFDRDGGLLGGIETILKAYGLPIRDERDFIKKSELQEKYMDEPGIKMISDAGLAIPNLPKIEKIKVDIDSRHPKGEMTKEEGELYTEKWTKNLINGLNQVDSMLKKDNVKPTEKQFKAILSISKEEATEKTEYFMIRSKKYTREKLKPIEELKFENEIRKVIVKIKPE